MRVFAKFYLIVSKVLTILLSVACLQVSAKGNAQGNVTIDAENVSVKKVFDNIKKQMGYHFVYNEMMGKETCEYWTFGRCSVTDECEFNSINPNDIEKVAILKNAAATSIWGPQGENGIVITTNRAKFYPKSGTGNNRTSIENPHKFSLRQLITTKGLRLYGQGRLMSQRN